MEQTPQVEHSINERSFIESQSVRMNDKMKHITIVCTHVHVQIESSHYQNVTSFFWNRMMYVQNLKHSIQ